SLRRSLYWSSSSVAPHRTPFTWGGGVCSFQARDFRSSGSCAMSIVDAFHSKNASKVAIKGAKGAKRIWLALLEAGFPFQMLWGAQICKIVSLCRSTRGRMGRLNYTRSLSLEEQPKLQPKGVLVPTVARQRSAVAGVEVGVVAELHAQAELGIDDSL